MAYLCIKGIEDNNGLNMYLIQTGESEENSS